MQLVINTYGSYLRKKGNCFLVRKEDEVFEVSVNKVDSILITTAAYISTDAIKFAVDNNIDLVFLDSYGDPYGRVWHPKLGSTTLIRRRQLEIYDKDDGLKLAKKWGIQKFDNQIELLKKLKKTRADKKDELERRIKEIEQSKERMKGLKGTIEERRQTMLGLEGMAAKNYFEALSSVVPGKYKFEGRSRNPAKDEFNVMLNYGYGVLYSMVEKACIIAGLDPYIGFLHTDNYNKKSLVFDIIEMFRTFVDETVVHLFSKRKVKEEYFDTIQNGLSLNKEGKAVLIEALNETFEKTIKYKGRNIKTKNVIQFECHRIANGLIKKTLINTDKEVQIMLVWVIYDIAGDKIRGYVAKLCKGYGLYRVQKSAFLGDLNRNEADSIAMECEELIEETDSVFVFPMCDDCFKKIKLIGEGFDKELVSDEKVTKIF